MATVRDGMVKYFALGFDMGHWATAHTNLGFAPALRTQPSCWASAELNQVETDILRMHFPNVLFIQK